MYLSTMHRIIFGKWPLISGMEPKLTIFLPESHMQVWFIEVSISISGTYLIFTQTKLAIPSFVWQCCIVFRCRNINLTRCWFYNFLHQALFVFLRSIRHVNFFVENVRKNAMHRSSWESNDSLGLYSVDVRALVASQWRLKFPYKYFYNTPFSRYNRRFHYIWGRGGY